MTTPFRLPFPILALLMATCMLVTQDPAKFDDRGIS